MNITSELGSFIEVENHEALKIGEPEENSEAKVVTPKFNKEIFPNAAVRDGVRVSASRR